MISAYFAAVAPFVLICTESCFEFTTTFVSLTCFFSMVTALEAHGYVIIVSQEQN